MAWLPGSQDCGTYQFSHAMLLQPVGIFAVLQNRSKRGHDGFLVELRPAQRGQSRGPVDRFGHAGRLEQLEGTHGLDRGRHLTSERFSHLRRSEANYGYLPLEARMLNPVVEAAPLEGVVDVACAVGGENHQRRRLGRERAELGDGDRVIGQHFQQEGLELVVGPVDLVDEQHGHRSFAMGDGPQQWPPHQEALRIQLVFGFGGRADGLGRSEMQELAGVVPFVDGLGHIDAFVTLQPQQLTARPSRQHLGHFGLAHAGFAFEQQRAAQCDREEDHRSQAFVGQIAVGPQGGAHFVYGRGARDDGLMGHESTRLVPGLGISATPHYRYVFMPRMRFGAFVAPHHPVGEHPMLQFRRDLDLAEQLDKLGLDEFWCGEHHSSGWEMIGSPEMFLAAAGERTHRIMLGTGVTSLPYHHPFNVAQRLAQLDQMTGGRAMFGSGPGALPSDARTLNIDPMTQRDRQDEALGVIIRLLNGEERFDYKSEWFELREAAIQILPLQEKLPMVTASSISPSGMKIAGKYGIGVLSIASNSTEGLLALPTQWAFAEESAVQHGSSVNRADWRVMMAFHLAETEEQARREAVDGLARWNNEYNYRILGRPDAVHYDDKWELMDRTAGGPTAAGTAVIGTPDQLVASIRSLQKTVGGFGAVIGFAHDWANREATQRSWDLLARYVVPEINGYTRSMRESSEYLVKHQATLMAGASAAIVAQIKRDPKAKEAMAITIAQRSTAGAGSSAAAAAALAADHG